MVVFSLFFHEIPFWGMGENGKILSGERYANGILLCPWKIPLGRLVQQRKATVPIVEFSSIQGTV